MLPAGVWERVIGEEGDPQGWREDERKEVSQVFRIPRMLHHTHGRDVDLLEDLETLKLVQS